MPADDDTLGRLREGGAAVLAELFAARRARLRRMISWRIDPRLNGRQSLDLAFRVADLIRTNGIV